MGRLCTHPHTNIFVNRPILSIEGTLKGTNSLGKFRARNNDNEGVFNTFQVSRSGDSPSDAVQHRRNVILF